MKKVRENEVSEMYTKQQRETKVETETGRQTCRDIKRHREPRKGRDTGRETHR